MESKIQPKSNQSDLPYQKSIAKPPSKSTPLDHAQSKPTHLCHDPPDLYCSIKTHEPCQSPPPWPTTHSTKPTPISTHPIKPMPISTHSTKPTSILTISTHLINHHADLDPLHQDHAAKPPDNAGPTIMLEKMNHYERDVRPRMFWREREDEKWRERKWQIFIGENKKLLFCFTMLPQYHHKFTMVL